MGDVTMPASTAGLHNCTSQVVAVLLFGRVHSRPAVQMSALCDEYLDVDGDALAKLYDDTIVQSKADG